jgi:hypothetical protein
VVVETKYWTRKLQLAGSSGGWNAGQSIQMLKRKTTTCRENDFELYNPEGVRNTTVTDTLENGHSYEQKAT